MELKTKAGNRKFAHFKDREPLYDHFPSVLSARVQLKRKIEAYDEAKALDEKIRCYSSGVALSKALDELKMSFGEAAVALVDDVEDGLAMRALEIIHEGTVTISDKVAVRAILTLLEGYRSNLRSPGASSSSRLAQDPSER